MSLKINLMFVQNTKLKVNSDKIMEFSRYFNYEKETW